jgi:hypothetical protein
MAHKTNVPARGIPTRVAIVIFFFLFFACPWWNRGIGRHFQASLEADFGMRRSFTAKR